MEPMYFLPFLGYKISLKTLFGESGEMKCITQYGISLFKGNREDNIFLSDPCRRLVV